MDEAKYHDILMKGWTEAGTLCRSIEQLTRSSLTLFLPTATAIAGVVVAPNFSPLIKLVLAVAGLAYALLLANTVYRSQAYYSTYVARARAIESLIKQEATPVMALYTTGAEATNSTRTFSNKSAIGAVFLVAAVFFLGAAVYNACQVFQAARGAV